MRRNRRREGLVVFFGCGALVFLGLLAGLIVALVQSSNALNDARNSESNIYTPVIKAVYKNSIDITGTFTGSNTAYQYVGVIQGGSETDSLETPAGSLPLYNPAFGLATFSGANIGTGNVVVNAFYSGPTKSSTLLAQVEFKIDELCYVDVITSATIPNDGTEYPFQLDPYGPIINNEQEAIDYFNATVSNRNDAGCFMSLLNPLVDVTASTYPVQIISKRMIMTYSTASMPVRFCTVQHIRVVTDCLDSGTQGNFMNMIFDYGDGTRERIIDPGASLNVLEHNYTMGGPPLVNVTVYGIMRTYSCYALRQIHPGPSNDLIDVVQWGDVLLVQVNFYQEQSFQKLTAGNIPSTIIDVSFFFSEASGNVLDTLKPWYNIGSWDVSNVVSFARMFDGTNATGVPTTTDLSEWTFSTSVNSINMCRSFKDASVPISGFNSWTTTRFVSIVEMFENYLGGELPVSTWFNFPTLSNFLADKAFKNVTVDVNITPWTVGPTSIGEMFFGYQGTGINITNWDLSNVVNGQCDDFIGATTPFSSDLYDIILIKFEAETAGTVICDWSTQINAQYSAAAATARSDLITRGWTINDLGPV